MEYVTISLVIINHKFSLEILCVILFNSLWEYFCEFCLRLFFYSPALSSQFFIIQNCGSYICLPMYNLIKNLNTIPTERQQNLQRRKMGNKKTIRTIFFLRNIFGNEIARPSSCKFGYVYIYYQFLIMNRWRRSYDIRALGC